ncbi:uncharacterized protein LOC133350132 [Lethenteron reissneri]|uniref:uncharacterized protein LOC133350132 n=1 Tax=Lethenteron reissneri TaxID=7753 RepID=UPI002AB71F1D|nr:uncharacterized protein LOC133350132 [Lethenteron reissneri]
MWQPRAGPQARKPLVPCGKQSQPEEPAPTPQESAVAAKRRPSPPPPGVTPSAPPSRSNTSSSFRASFDDVPSRPVWIIPIHEQSHWQILVIVNTTCPPRSTAMLLDSMAARGQSRNAKSIAAFASAVVVRVVCAEPVSTPVAIATVALVPQQPNDYDCGVYALLNIMHLVHDYDSIVAVQGPGQVDWRAWYTQEAVSQHRRDLLQQLHELKDLHQQ